MAFSDAFAGGGGTGGNQSSGSTYFANQGQLPDYIRNLVDVLFRQGQGAAGQYNDFISNPAGHPLFQNALSGLLASLAPSEAQARQGTTDAGRAAGNMASGAFANASARTEGDILRNRSTVTSQLLSSLFPQIASALQHPQDLAAQLASQLKLSQQFGAPQGGGGGSSSSSGSSFLSQPFTDLSGFGVPNPYPGNADPSLALSGVNYNPQNQLTWDQILRNYSANPAGLGSQTPQGTAAAAPNYDEYTYAPAGNQFTFGGSNGFQ